MSRQRDGNALPEQLPPPSFGEWLRRQRRLRDLTQEELAKRTGCARVTIRKVEADERRPSKQLAELLAQAMDIPSGARDAFVQFARGTTTTAEPPTPHVMHSVPANNLPLQLTSFIGRESEVVDLKLLLATTHLLTLTGSGGTGKTRLSLQVAAECLSMFKDGVWLIELAAITDPALVPVTVASVLGVREEPGRPLSTTLLESLRHKELLIILDNCEHLIDACAQFVEAVLRSSPEVRILATSREALGITGESVWQVPSLPVPDPAVPHTMQQLGQYTAFQLFVERAKQSHSTFSATDSNAAAIAQICYRLDGIPLAIELAAARIKALSPEQIATRLDDRFRLLTGGSRTALPRQQTLRALVDWSHSLLSEPERILLRRLAVFAGGWPLATAERVCVGAGIESGEVLDLLTLLIQKSLVMFDEQAAEPRYRMLETIRQYAREKLLESGESAQIYAQHLEALLQFAEAAAPNLSGPSEARWLNRLESDHDNLRSALGWALDHGESAAALRLSGSLSEFWQVRGYWSEGRQWLQQALELSRRSADPVAMSSDYRGSYARALNAAGALASSQGDYAAAHELLDEGLSLSRALGEKHAIAVSLLNLGTVARTQGENTTARALQAESLALSRELADKRGTAAALQALGITARSQSDVAAARALLAESLALSRELEDRRGTTAALQNLGVTARIQGDDGAAQALLEESLNLSRAAGDTRFMSLNLMALGGIASQKGDYTSARTLLRQSLMLSQESGYRFCMAWCFFEFGRMAHAEGQPQRAARLLSAAEALLERMGADLEQFGRALSVRTRDSVRAQLDAAAFKVAWEEGRELTQEQAIAEALRTEPPA